MPEQLRQPTDTRRIPDRSIRHVTAPRWVAMYEGGLNSGLKEGRRRVGLLVPRPSPQDPNGRSQIAYSYDGKLMEFKIGSTPDLGAWWTAHATELPRDQWMAIRNHWFYLTRR